MTTSDQINDIAAALAKAQAEMGGALKDSANPCVVFRADQIGKKGHNSFQWLACESCGKERWVVLLKDRKPKALLCVRCATAAFNRTRQGAKSPFWKGGRRDSDGYVMLYIPDGHVFASMRVGGTVDGQYRRYVAEHRLVMATHLGRALRTDELVHHKDGDRANNAIGNLEVTSRGKHSKDHSKGYEHGFSQGYSDGVAAAKATKQ